MIYTCLVLNGMMDKHTHFLLTLILLILLIIVLYYTFVYYGLSGLSAWVIDKIVLYRRTRLVLALASGLILGFIGSFLQSSFRNPLIDPYILGIGGGALFALYIFHLFFKTASLYWIALVASAGGLMALAITVVVAEAIGGSDIAYILSGIGVTSLFSGLSITIYYIIISVNPAASYIHTLLIGSFVHANPSHIPIITLSVAALVVAYFMLSKPLNSLIIGDTYAKQLGYNPRAVRRVVTILSGITASIVVMVAGIIGFIGLVSPHIARLIMGTGDNRLVIPISGLIGSILLILTDNFSRIVLSNLFGEVPVGALVSSFGAPFFLLLLIRRFKGRI